MSDLGKKTFNGFYWNTIETVFLKGIVFIGTIIIARIIGPDEFGIFGMISIFLGIGVTISDSGMATSLIRTRNCNSTDYSTVYISNILLAIFIYVTVFGFAPLVESFYEQHGLSKIIRIYSLIFLIMSFSAVQLATLTKDMNFQKITKINIIPITLGVSIGIVMSNLGYGIWSLVCMYLIIESIKTISLIILCDWKPQISFSKKKFKRHFHFGYKLMLSSLIDVTFKNTYNIIIGKSFGVFQLAQFERSRQLNDYPTQTSTGIITRVIFPLLSKLQGKSDELKVVYKKIIQLTLYLVAPIILILGANANSLISIILGDKWSYAAEYFTIISFGSILYPVHVLSLNLIKAFGRSDLFLKIEVLKKLILIIGIVLAIPFGVKGLAYSTIGISIISMFINIHHSGKLIRYSSLQQLKDLAMPLLIGILTFIVPFAALKIHPIDNIYLDFSRGIFLGVITLFILNFFIKESTIVQINTLKKYLNDTHN